MTLDERVKRLLELLSQVSLRPPAIETAAPQSSAPLADDAAGVFDPEMTLVDADVPLPELKTAASAASPPESETQESRSRLIAAQRSDLDYDLDEDTKTSLDKTQEMPSYTGDVMDLLTNDPDDAEPAPGSSRRPVLPDDVAPALPDVEWEDTANGSTAPPESGPHFATSDDESDVTGVRSAASLQIPEPKPSHVAPTSAAKPASVAPFLAASRSKESNGSATFGDLLDDSLDL